MPCPQPDDPAPTSVPDATTSTICVKCRTNPAISIFRDSVYCQSCALAVFYQKSKSGLEYARGAGLAKYVTAAKADTLASSSAASTSAATSSANAEGSKGAKQVNNGGGNAEVNVSANIAIAFSGGASSRALLRSAVQYFRPETVVDRAARRKKGREGKAEATPIEVASDRKNGAAPTGRFNEVGKIYVFFVDDSALIPDGVDRTEEARKMVEEESCPDLHFVPLKIEDVYRAPLSPCGVPWRLDDSETQYLASTPTSVSDPTQAIKDLFSSLHPSNTPRTGASSARTRVEDLHRILLNTLLRRTAAEYDCSALLLGDSATRISIRLIEDLAKGAGHKLPVQGSDAVWIDDLLIVRPLKGHLMQEILFYTSALGLEPLSPEQHVVPPTVSTNDILSNQNSNVPVMDKSSIARLTETFILNLEKGVPSTVTTIGKTGSKLVLNSTDSASSNAESVANSTSGFQQVGPSVSLKSRTPVPTDSLSSLTLSDPSEPRIGSRGIKLAQTSASCFHWSTSSGCAFCGMPSQHPHARHWKRNITISSLAETAPSQQKQQANGEGEGWLELADHLCYACLLVLSPPATEGGEKVLLPSYVLEHIRRSSQSDANDVEAHLNGGKVDGDEEEAELTANGQTGGCGNHQTPQPLKQSEMKAQINEFLLED